VIKLPTATATRPGNITRTHRATPPVSRSFTPALAVEVVVAAEEVAEVDEPEVDEPEVDEPEVDEPEADEPEVDEPEVDEPEVDVPELAAVGGPKLPP
jgi:hypothetical protein